LPFLLVSTTFLPSARARWSMNARSFETLLAVSASFSVTLASSSIAIWVAFCLTASSKPWPYAGIAGSTRTIRARCQLRVWRKRMVHPSSVYRNETPAQGATLPRRLQAGQDGWPFAATHWHGDSSLPAWPRWTR